MATALLELASKVPLERSLEDLSLAESLLGLGEERIDGKNVNEDTANDSFSNSEDDINIDGNFIKSSPVGHSSPIPTIQHAAVQVCMN